MTCCVIRVKTAITRNQKWTSSDCEQMSLDTTIKQLKRSHQPPHARCRRVHPVRLWLTGFHRQRKRAKSVLVALGLVLISLTPTGVPGIAARTAAAPRPDASLVHPRLLFSQVDLPEIKRRSSLPILQPTVKRLIERAEWQLTAPPII